MLDLRMLCCCTVALCSVALVSSRVFAQERRVPILSSSSSSSISDLAMLGRGYNSLTGEVKLPCIKYERDDWDGLVPQGTGVTSQTVVRSVEDTQSLLQFMNIDASVLLRLGGEWGLSGGFLQETKMDHFSAHVVVKAEAQLQPIVLKHYVYEDWVIDLLEHGGNDKDFLRLCGNEFIAGIEVGGVFLGDLVITTSSQEVNQTIKSSFKGDAGVSKIEGSLELRLRSLDKLGAVNGTVIRKGGNSPLPDITAAAFITAANSLSTDVAHAPSAMAIVTKSYDDLPSPRVNVFEFRQQELVLGELGKKYASLVTLRNDADLALDPGTASMFEKFDVDNVRKMRALVIKGMTAINQASANCFKDWNTCQDVTVEIPISTLARRRDGTSSDRCLDGTLNRQCSFTGACGTISGEQRCSESRWSTCAPPAGVSCDCRPGQTQRYTCPDKDSNSVDACTRVQSCRQDRTWTPQSCEDCKCKPGQIAVQQSCSNGCLGSKKCSNDGTHREECPQVPCPSWAGMLGAGCSGGAPASANTPNGFSWSVTSIAENGFITQTEPPAQWRCGQMIGSNQVKCELHFNLRDGGKFKNIFTAGSGCWHGTGKVLTLSCGAGDNNNTGSNSVDYQSGMFPSDDQRYSCNGKVTLTKRQNEVQLGWGCLRRLENVTWVVTYEKMYCDGNGPAQ